MANLGHEIVLSDIRAKIRSIFIRLCLSLGTAVFALIGCSITFGPKNVFTYAFNYWFYYLVFEIKKSIPLFKISEKDIHNVAHNYGEMMAHEWFWKWSLIICCFVFVLSFVLLSYFFFKKGERNALERIMRGNQLITPVMHNKVMKVEYKNKPPFEMGSKLILGKNQVLIPESLQYLHFAFIGASGCGKSTAIEQVISHAQLHKEKALIVDLNGAFYSKFGRPGDHVLSLRDPRTRAWDFWCEKGVEPENMAAAMIEAAGDSNQYFWKGARAVLSSLLKHTKNSHELWEDFKKSTKEIRAKLENSNEISQRVIGSGDGDQADGILGTTVLDFPFLKELNQWNDPKEDKVSITEWMNNNNDRSWIYLVVSDKDLEISKPLLRVWFDLACLASLSRDALNPENVHTWLIIDELKSVGQLPSLPAILDKGRKYKSSVVLGFQAISQIKKIYGEQDARSILQGVQNQFYFRMSEFESAEHASDALGEQELEQANLGVSFGQSNNSDRGSINKTSTRKKVVLPDEIRSLKSLLCYAKLCHHQPFKMEFEVTQRKRIQEPARSVINHDYIIGKNNEDFKKTALEEISADKKIESIKAEAQGLPWLSSEQPSEANV